eukprot:1664304-Prymnesium_polylepis.1
MAQRSAPVAELQLCPLLRHLRIHRLVALAIREMSVKVLRRLETKQAAWAVMVVLSVGVGEPLPALDPRVVLGVVEEVDGITPSIGDVHGHQQAAEALLVHRRLFIPQGVDVDTFKAMNA